MLVQVNGITVNLDLNISKFIDCVMASLLVWCAVVAAFVLLGALWLMIRKIRKELDDLRTFLDNLGHLHADTQDTVATNANWWREQWNSRARLKVIMHPGTHLREPEPNNEGNQNFFLLAVPTREPEGWDPSENIIGLRHTRARLD